MNPTLQQALTVLQIISIIMSLVVTTFGFVFKRELKRLDDADLENKKKLEDLHHDVQKIASEREKCNRECIQAIGNLREDVTENYVRQSEFVRIYSELTKKLDKIFDMLYELKGRDKA